MSERYIHMKLMYNTYDLLWALVPAHSIRIADNGDFEFVNLKSSSVSSV